MCLGPVRIRGTWRQVGMMATHEWSERAGEGEGEGADS